MKKIFSHRTAAWLIPLVFIVLIFSNADVPVLGFWELKTRDLRFVVRGQEKPGDDVVILAIDENSLNRIGRWPWSRSVMANAITLLKQGGATAVALDLIFSEPEVTVNLKLIQNLISEYTRLGLLGDTLESQEFFSKMVGMSEQENHDETLVQALHSAQNVVLPMAFADGQSADIFPLRQFIEASPRLGFVNIRPDADGAIRRSIAVIRTRDERFLSLPIRAIQKHLNLKSKEIRFLPENNEIRLGTLPIFTDSEAMVYINHYGKTVRSALIHSQT
ncbi:MAG: CHASE2 domain-containing protein [Desulfobacteraceae bacterium]|nr:CHASE2 domain-containing protein [Desulfobacteraceae bacterium]